MNKSRQFNFAKTNIDDIHQWLRKEIQNGHFPEYSQCSDEEVLFLAHLAAPYIQIELDIANSLALEQIEKLNKSDKTVLSSSNPLV